jgi:hypothetical protein
MSMLRRAMSCAPGMLALLLLLALAAGQDTSSQQGEGTSAAFLKRYVYSLSR